MAARTALLCILVACSACEEKRQLPAPAKPSATALPAASAQDPTAPPEASSDGVIRLPATARSEDELGYSVAAAADRVLVSAFKRQPAGNDEHPGAVLVYRLEGGRAVFETELSAEKSHQLGNMIAFDGKTLVAGALYDAGKKPETGAAYVFSRGDDGWSKAVKLASSQSQADDSFGIGVALAGGSVIVGDSRESGGSLFLFESGPKGFTQKQALKFPEPSGPAETLAAHGDHLVVGAQFGGEEEHGSVRVYTKGEKGLAETQVLTEPKAEKERHFGGAVAIGPNAIVAASEAALTIFTAEGGQFRSSGTITPPITTGLADAALAIGSDVLAVGFPIVDEGRVLVYRLRAGTWKLDRILRSPEGKKGDWFGFSLALGPKHLVIGAPFENDRAGAAYVVSL